jgi:hypothetical protein
MVLPLIVADIVDANAMPALLGDQPIVIRGSGACAPASSHELG